MKMVGGGGGEGAKVESCVYCRISRGASGVPMPTPPPPKCNPGFYLEVPPHDVPRTCSVSAV